MNDPLRPFYSLFSLARESNVTTSDLTCSIRVVTHLDPFDVGPFILSVLYFLSFHLSFIILAWIYPAASRCFLCAGSPPATPELGSFCSDLHTFPISFWSSYGCGRSGILVGWHRPSSDSALLFCFLWSGFGVGTLHHLRIGFFSELGASPSRLLSSICHLIQLIHI